MKVKGRTTCSRLLSWGATSAVSLAALVAACNSNNSGTTNDGGTDSTASGSSSGSGSGVSSGSGARSGSSGSPSTGTSSGSGSSGIRDGGSDAAEAGASMCASPGMPTPGPTDMHCVGPDGGMMVQPTSPASCMPDVGAPEASSPDATTSDASDAAASDAGAMCDYGPTMFGMESDDDDCKYHVKWSSTPICEGAPGVVFTVIVTHKTDGSPLTGANPGIEAFTTSPGDWDSSTFCDTLSTHPSAPPSGGYWPLTESTTTPGTYSGPVQFDTPGQWTIRYHFNHNCFDLLPDSPHGHAAYHLTVP